jgi:hypothetical protein
MPVRYRTSGRAPRSPSIVSFYLGAEIADAGDGAQDELLAGSQEVAHLLRWLVRDEAASDLLIDLTDGGVDRIDMLEKQPPQILFEGSAYEPNCEFYIKFEGRNGEFTCEDDDEARKAAAAEYEEEDQSAEVTA